MNTPALNFSISEPAGDKLLDVLDLSKDQKLRISIRGGGCAGFEYQFDIEDNQEEGDFRFEKSGAVVLIDPISAPYLEGSELDYVAEMFGAKFVLKNPNAKTTCGCGSSFAS